MTIDLDLADSPVALVTGSASVIGAAIARRLAADGMRVVVHSRIGSAEAGEQVARDIGGIYLSADLVDPTQASALPARVVAEFGRLDVLANIVWHQPADPTRRSSCGHPEDLARDARRQPRRSVVGHHRPAGAPQKPRVRR